jgi:hypothetical protein
MTGRPLPSLFPTEAQQAPTFEPLRRGVEATARWSHRSITAATLVGPSERVILADATGGAFSVTLPPAKDNPNRYLTIKRTNSGSNAVTVACSGSETIDGSSTFSLSTQWDSVTVWSDGGVAWYIL